MELITGSRGRGELIPVLRGRPPVLKHQGQFHYVSIHDTNYLRNLRAFRTELVNAHPDKGGNVIVFYRVKRSLEAYRRKERAYYWSIGLMPPDWSIVAPPPEVVEKEAYRDRERVYKEIRSNHPQECQVWDGKRCCCKFPRKHRRSA